MQQHMEGDGEEKMAERERDGAPFPRPLDASLSPEVGACVSWTGAGNLTGREPHEGSAPHRYPEDVIPGRPIAGHGWFTWPNVALLFGIPE